MMAFRPVPAAQNWEFTLSYGPWTAFPFTPLIENECRNMIDQELNTIMDWAYPLLLIRNEEEDIDFASGGGALSLSLSHHLSASPLSISLELSWLALNLPYTLSYRQSLDLLGVPIASAQTNASGQARIRSADYALWVQYRLWQTSSFTARLAVGGHLLIMRGDISLQGNCEFTSIIGDDELTFNEHKSIQDLRNGGIKVPRSLFFPSLSLNLSTRLWRPIHLQTRLVISQGLFLTAGLSLQF